MTLLAHLQERIRSQGPLPLAEYMHLCLMHPKFGYYTTRDPFGASGDFTTAPEMTQAFGELLGLWAVEMWKNLGSPAEFILCELGPGRGTLMKDALRATQLVPDFMVALRLYLLEASPVLKERQAAALQGYNPQWISHPDQLPPLPVIFLANEFFDALPVRQFEAKDGRWFERAVALDAQGQLGVILVETADAPDFPAEDGSVLEHSPIAVEFANAIARPIVHNRGAALVIDYGDEETVGATLQAVAGHRQADLLTAPGTADLTAHISFGPLRTAVRKIGTKTYGLTDMGEFLLNLGLKERTDALRVRADAAQQRSLTLALARLTDMATPAGMGRLFKVFAFTDRNCPPPPGF